jgi:hemerythrin-like domain-containing protein
MNAATRPIKRDQHIVRLSREHHTGLLFGWKIRQGLKNSTAPERIVQYARYFWQQHLLPHFREEEEILFVPIPSDPQVARAKQEHKGLKQLIEGLDTHSAAVPLAKQLQQLADELDRHIRFEERELFPHLEKALTADQLESIGRQLDAIPAPEEEDRFEDAFWKVKSSL